MPCFLRLIALLLLSHSNISLRLLPIDAYTSMDKNNSLINMYLYKINEGKNCKAIVFRKPGNQEMETG